MGEHLPYKQGVIGSSPMVCTKSKIGGDYVHTIRKERFKG